MIYRLKNTRWSKKVVHLAFLWLMGVGAGAVAFAHDLSEPVVARVRMQFKLKEEIIDEIVPGDLLTVLKEQGDAYMVATFNQKKGWVNKVNVLTLAESVETYDELIKPNAANGRLYTLRAGAWWARGDQKKALADFDKAIELGYQEAHAYASRGMLQAALGNFDRAIADYGTSIEKDAKDDSSYLNRAAVFMTQQKYELAIKDYDHAVRLNSQKASTFQQRAVAWKLSGQTDRAIADFGKAIELDPKNVPAWTGRGFLWFRLGESEKAIADFSEVIKLDPNAAQAYNNRGYNRQLLGDYKNALADYEAAVKTAPEFALAYQNKAWLLAAGDKEIRNGKKAIEAATKACQLRDYKSLADIKALAAAFAEDGQFDKAIGWQEKAVEMAVAEQKEGERGILEKYRSKTPFRLADLADKAEKADGEKK